ncbi:MAG: chemotaxis response regulator protein-glutamate methylesterase [Hyphomicrobiales bacterium]|nr:chemotaxis response regulator protein-glutamate methylesterase [Hyphomicrobiales bacterium]
MRPVRVLVVDDSATMRGLIVASLSRDPGISVVGQAADPLLAREAIKALDPDVMTLDVEMPKMDGLEFLEKVMRLRPFPVVMVSSLTAKGAGATIRAMELGAVDCIGKPSIDAPNSFDDLPARVKAAASARIRRRFDDQAARPAASAPAYRSDGKLVAIGASTGGVEALIAVLTGYPVNCPPTVITLHMPTPFTKSFARRLDGLTPAKVTEAEDGAPLEAGRVYLAPGSATHLEVAHPSAWRCRLNTDALVNGHRPSVDVLFNSVAKTCGHRALGVILTGMGKDGAAGLLAMRKAGSRTIGQNEGTSVVYGMPKVAFESGAVEKQLSLGDIGAEILALTSTQNGKS